MLHWLTGNRKITLLFKQFIFFALIFSSFALAVSLNSCKSCNPPSTVLSKRVKVIGNIDSSNSGVGTGLLAVSRYSSYFGVATGEGGKIATTTNSGINWVAQNSGGITDSLLSVDAIDSDTVVAVGRKGIIIRSTNKGVTWNTVFLDTTKRLKFVSFGQKKYGLTVGDNGIVLKSNNSGLNWTIDTLNNAGNNLHWLNINCASMTVTDSSSWVCCDSGKIFFTNDFGATWTQQLSGVNLKLNGISFSDNQRGTCVGSNSTMLETYNGGISWILDTVPNPGKELLSVSRSDNFIVFVSGIGYLFREHGNDKTVIFNNSFYKCVSISVFNTYMVAFAINSNDNMIYKISCDECPCSRCSHQITIIPLLDETGCTWEIRGRFNMANSYRDVLRIIIGGGTFPDNTIISGWTQNDNVNSQIPIVVNSSTTSTPLEQYCSVSTGRENLGSSTDLFIKNNTPSESQNFHLKLQITGNGSSQIEFYFGSENDSALCINHCQHSIYEITCP